MDRIMRAVKMQMMQIAEFCNMCGIPYDIYGFSDNPSACKQTNKQGQPYQHYALLHLLSSRMSRSEYKEAFESIPEIGTTHYGYEKINLEATHTTPLQAAKYASIGIVSDFKKRNPTLQKVHMLFITDGAASDRILYINKNVSQLLAITIDKKKFTYKTKTSKNNLESSEILLYDLFKKFHPDVTFSNLFLMPAYGRTGTNYSYPFENTDPNYKDFHTVGIYSRENPEIYDQEFVINANSLSSIKGKIGNSKYVPADEEELIDTFEGDLNLRKRSNVISRKIAEFLA
jgi:hypothetical protein